VSGFDVAGGRLVFTANMATALDELFAVARRPPRDGRRPPRDGRRPPRDGEGLADERRLTAVGGAFCAGRELPGLERFTGGFRRRQ
jgi:hypothetical protein